MPRRFEFRRSFMTFHGGFVAAICKFRFIYHFAGPSFQISRILFQILLFTANFCKSICISVPFQFGSQAVSHTENGVPYYKMVSNLRRFVTATCKFHFIYPFAGPSFRIQGPPFEFGALLSNSGPSFQSSRILFQILLFTANFCKSICISVPFQFGNQFYSCFAQFLAQRMDIV